MTNKQKQNLLQYLGYYSGAIDGIWGEQSKGATVGFQLHYMEQEDVDGDFGPKTEARILEVIATGEEPKEADTNVGVNVDTTAPEWWEPIPYFTWDEFRCPCGRCGGFPVRPTREILAAAVNLREQLGSPVVIVPPDGHSGGSGVRCQAYNDSLPGSVPNSRHVQGKAADFIAPGKSDTAVEAILEDMKNTGMIRYWYCISPGAHHMDVL